MQNLWPNDIADSMSTALFSFMYGNLFCYLCTTWSMFTVSPVGAVQWLSPNEDK